jgi:hypothetical protein
MGGPLSEGQIAEVQSRIAATKGRTGACYRYLLGASAFLADSYGEEDDYGQKEFEAVVAGFPRSPARGDGALHGGAGEDAASPDGLVG